MSLISNNMGNPLEQAAAQTFGLNGAKAASAAAPASGTSAAQGVSGSQDLGPSQQRLANAKLGQSWSDISSGDSYKAMFGNQPYVKDGSDPQLLSLLQQALQKAPELQSTPLAEHVAAGKVGPEDIKSLQSFLQSKGYSVGPPGVDGKFGPLTDKALEHFLHGDPADAASSAGASRSSSVAASSPGHASAPASSQAPKAHQAKPTDDSAGPILEA
jgi:hypothetical protein